jgi:hypothetical protein
MNVQTPPKPYHDFSRWDKRATTGEIELTPTRLNFLFAFFKHGYLSSDMLYALAGRGSHSHTSRELMKLKRDPNSYLEQPEDQQDARYARCNFLIYRLSPKGADALFAAGLISEDDLELWHAIRSLPRSNAFWHDVATGYATASFELGCRQLGLTFLSVYDILRNHNWRKRPTLSIPYGKTHITPDALFGISDGIPTYFALETEMGGNQTKLNEIKHTARAKKYLAYRNMWDRELYKEAYGVNFLKVLFLTTFQHAQTKLALKQIAETERSGYGALYLRTAPYINRRKRSELTLNGTMILDLWDRMSAPPTTLYK